jgi:hypothetical protein
VLDTVAYSTVHEALTRLNCGVSKQKCRGTSVFAMSEVHGLYCHTVQLCAVQQHSVCGNVSAHDELSSFQAETLPRETVVAAAALNIDATVT